MHRADGRQCLDQDHREETSDYAVQLNGGMHTWKLMKNPTTSTRMSLRLSFALIMILKE
jgi:hypothetical protein